jgi:hypothetical protein
MLSTYCYHVATSYGRRFLLTPWASSRVTLGPAVSFPPKRDQTPWLRCCGAGQLDGVTGAIESREDEIKFQADANEELWKRRRAMVPFLPAMR